MKKALKPILIAVISLLISVGLIFLGFFLFYYEIGNAYVNPVPITNEIDGNTYLTGYVDEAILSAIGPSGKLMSKKANERISFFNENQMSITAQFLEHFGDYTQIDCKIRTFDKDRIVLTYSGIGCDKVTKEQYSILAQVDYNLSLSEKPTVTYTPAGMSNNFYELIEK